jgi:hypothetical protein
LRKRLLQNHRQLLVNATAGCRLQYPVQLRSLHLRRQDLLRRRHLDLVVRLLPTADSCPRDRLVEMMTMMTTKK